MTLDDLQDADEPQLLAAQNIIWSYKAFLYDLSNKGSQHFFTQLKAHADEANKQWIQMLESMPEDTTREMISAWFPNLAKEISEHRSKKTVKTKSIEEESPAMKLRSETFENTGETWAHHGGWYWEGYNLYYRPRHHSDRFMVNWIKLSSQLANKGNQQADFAFQLLSDPRTPGSCMKCHTVEKQDEMSNVYWEPLKNKNQAKPFTKFSHQAHLSIKDCKTCHVINKGVDYLESFEDRDPSKFLSGFTHIKKEQCTQCHNQEKVFDNCTGCHNYHR